MNLHTNLTSLLLPSKPHVIIPSTRRRFTHLQQRRNYKIVRCSIKKEEVKFLEAGEAELIMATCITRTLTPALTLELGIQRIKDAVIELKSKRNHDNNAGMYRFQIVVSPGSKALSWFCCQDPSLEVFPQFFISAAVETSTNKFLSFSRTRGVFGIGAAVYIKTNFSSASADQISFRRYQPVDSTYPTAYGLFKNKSFYMFIPQIELVESDGLSILTATLAWNDSSRYEDAFDVIIRLITVLAMPNEDNRLNRCVSSVLRKFNMMVDEHAQMVYENALLLTDGCLEHMELVSLFSWKTLRYPRSFPLDFQLTSASPITCWINPEILVSC